MRLAGKHLVQGNISVESNIKGGSSGRRTASRVYALLLSLFLISPLAASANGTFVSGVIDGEVWSAAGSPYCVVGDVLVASLMIQPGVEVSFLSNYVFEVVGILQVKGTAGSPVRFTTTNAAVGWKGIWFIDSVPGSFFNHCTIERSKNSAVYVTNSAPVGGGVPAFTNCAIVNNFSPDYGGGIDATLTSGDLVLDHCLIGTNTCGFYGGGINAVLANGTLKMINCTIASNVANVGFAGGSYVGGGIRVDGDSILLNCVVTDNLCNAYADGNFQERVSYGGGIYSAVGNATFRNCRFQRNTAQSSRCCGSSSTRSWGGAVYFQDGYLTMQNCLVDTNTCSSTHDSSGAGVFVQSGIADIVNCTIVENNTQGVHNNGGTVNCLNSILFFNNGSGLQVGGTVTATFSDIQGGWPGEGNKAVNPGLRPGTLELFSTSPVIDMGNPDPRYNDSCFPPSRNAIRNDMGAYGGPAACCWVRPCGSPEVTSQPKNAIACINNSVTLCVSAIGDEPLNYQWRFHGTNASNLATNLTSGTNVCLNISNVSSNNAGFYSVVVANAFGSVESAKALLTVTPVCVDINLYAGLTITSGITGQVYRVQYVTNIDDTTWTTLTTITQRVTGSFVLDPQPANLQRRFYRVIP